MRDGNEKVVINAKDAKSEYISFRANELETVALDILCKMGARKKSEMLRELIREGAKSRGINIGAIIDKL